jgi:cytoskeletal protein CcmA (bactofilin family)
MPVEQDQRPTFYQGQYLGPEDLTAAVEYGRIQHARHSLGAHSWGIAIGLQLLETPSPVGNNQVDVFLEPGYAWDGFGRPCVVLAAYRVRTELFQNIVFDPVIDGGNPPGRLVKVWLSYRESATQPPQAGFEVCDVADQNSRIQETFQLEVGERPNISDQRDPVSIAGRQVDALEGLKKFDPDAPNVYDLSIPHQSLPEDDASALWLIPVGYVRWLPNQNPTIAGSFQKKTDQDKAASHSLRQYIGVVAGAVLAADKNVRVRDRGVQPSSIPSDDLLWVEGKLRAQGDVRLFGSKLSFLDPSGQDNNGIPLLLQRSDQPGVSSSLQVVIGKGHDGKNTVAVGPLDPSSSSFVPKLTVQDDGKVGLGTQTPSNRLHVDDALGIRQKYLYLSGDKGWSSLTYNAYHDATNQSWVFPDPARTAVTLEMDDQQGTGPRFQIFSTTSGARGTWIQRFVMNGESGDIYMAHNGGRVGINTTTPAALLDVNGDLRVGGSLDVAHDLHVHGLFQIQDLQVLGSADIAHDLTVHGAFQIQDLHVLGNADIANDLSVHGRVRGDLTMNGSVTIDVDLTVRGHVQGGLTINGGATVNNDFRVNGNIEANGIIYTNGIPPFLPSDLRLKTNIEPLEDALGSLLRLSGVTFQWKDPEKMGGDRGPQMGMIAQDVEKIFPQWVTAGPDGFKRLGTPGFEALVIEAIRELKTHVDRLSAQVHAAKKTNSAKKTTKD